jgi:hypothetical protein
MSAFETVLNDVFAHGAEARLDLEDERAALAEAQMGGEAATLRLIYAYAPALRNLVAQHSGRIGVEEARSAAIAGLLEAIHAFDLARFDGRLAGIVSGHISTALRAVSSTAMQIESRTLRRYRSILAAADGDFREALNKVGDFGMTRATFVAVHEALRTNHLAQEGGEVGGAPSASSINYAHPVWVPAGSDALVDADDQELVDLAWTAVSVQEKDVIRHAYGFADGEPHSDGDVAQILSVRDLGQEAVDEGQSTMSRAKAQRIRTRGVEAMKVRLAAEVA